MPDTMWTLRTDHVSSWDGSFTATCVHGQSVTWDAHIRSSWTCNCPPTQGEAETGDPQEWHVGRSFGGPSAFEMDCGCAKAPCGLVVLFSDKTCPQHGVSAGKTLRTSHVAERCQGAETHWLDRTRPVA